MNQSYSSTNLPSKPVIEAAHNLRKPRVNAGQCFDVSLFLIKKWRECSTTGPIVLGPMEIMEQIPNWIHFDNAPQRPCQRVVPMIMVENLC